MEGRVAFYGLAAAFESLLGWHSNSAFELPQLCWLESLNSQSWPRLPLLHAQSQ
jgi:hypothetical protein